MYLHVYRIFLNPIKLLSVYLINKINLMSKQNQQILYKIKILTIK